MSKDDTGQQPLLESGAGLQTNLGVSPTEAASRTDQSGAGPDQQPSTSDVSLPRGVVMHIEKSRPHEEFMWAARPDWVLLKIDYARRLVAEDETAESWTPPGTRVVTTSTVRDEKLAELTVETEVDIVNEFNPAAHVGGDVPVYQEWKQYRRIQGLRRLLINAAWLKAKTRDEVTIIPLVKGETPRERELVYDSLQVFDHNCMAYYAAQYFTAGTGVELDTVINQLDAIGEETASLGSTQQPTDNIEPNTPTSVQDTSSLGGVKSDASRWQDSMLSDGGTPAEASQPDPDPGPDPGLDSAPTTQQRTGGQLFVIGCVSQRLADVGRGIRATAGLNAWLSRIDADADTPVPDQYETAVTNLQTEFEDICSPE